MKSYITIFLAIAISLGSMAQERIAGPSKEVTGNRTSVATSNIDGFSLTASDLVEAILGLEYLTQAFHSQEPWVHQMPLQEPSRTG